MKLLPWLAIAGTMSVLGITSLTYAASTGPIKVGAGPIITAYAKREVLKVGMETTIVAHVTNASSSNIELYNETTGTYLAGDPLGGGGVGFVVSDSSAQIVTYQPVVRAAGLVHVVAGPTISIEWQADANSTSNGFSAPNGAGVNAIYYTTPANSAAPHESVTISRYRMPRGGFNSEVFAEAYGGPVLENFTDLSNGASANPKYTWAAPTNGKPMFYQMTAYAVPLINGTYDYAQQTKAFAPTYVANEPDNVPSVPESATLGTDLKIGGLTPGGAYWFTYVGFNTQLIKWQTVAANNQGEVTLPLNRLGAIKILIGNTVNYINVESPPPINATPRTPTSNGHHQ